MIYKSDSTPFVWSKRRERACAIANDGRKEEAEGLCDQRRGRGVLLVIFVMGGGYGGREA